jgi:arabinofuranosyltransferase
MPAKKQVKKTAQKQGTRLKDTLSKKNVKQITYFILIIIGIVFVYYCKAFDFIQDDSYITYRYVKNFTEGNGLVFNIGDKVEGYTCFLWVVLLSVVKKLGYNFISASQTLGIISSLLTLLFIYKISSDIFSKNKSSYYSVTFSLIAVILTISNGAYAYWSISGMETSLFAFLTTLGIYLYLKEIEKRTVSMPYSSIVFLLASLTRPEGNLIFGVTVIHKIIFIIKQKSRKDPDAASTNIINTLLARQNLLWLALYIIPGLIFMIWRYSYYGYLMPNTFYAKTGSSFEYLKTGWNYFLEFAQTYGLYGILLALILFTLRSKEKFYEYLYLVMIFFIFSLYIISIGGDVLRPARFFIPVLPVFYILIQEALHHFVSVLEKKYNLSYIIPIIIALVLVFSYYTYKDQYEQIKKYSELENGLVEKMRVSGQWLKSKSIAEGRTLTVAATTIGAISYFSDVQLIDMLGLTDKVIAHNPKPIQEISSKTEIGWKERHYNVDYVISRKPDYIYFSTGLKPSAYAERGLFTSDEFLKYYYPSYFTIKEYGFTDCIYKRKTDKEVKYTIDNLPPNPNYKKSFVNLFNQALNTYRDRSKTQEAITLFRQTLDAGPSNFAIPYQMIGDIYMQGKNQDSALANYKRAVQIDDFDIMAHYGLYQLYLRNGDTTNAFVHYEKIQKYSPDMLK